MFPGFKPANAIDISRDSYAGYAEVDADISKTFTLQAAGRYEHFSDFGDTVNGKVAARFEPIKGIAVRGSVSTGFRAPSLAQQYFSTTSTNNVGGVLIDIVTVPATSPIGTALGGKPLKAEKALNSRRRHRAQPDQRAQHHGGLLQHPHQGPRDADR